MPGAGGEAYKIPVMVKWAGENGVGPGGSSPSFAVVKRVIEGIDGATYFGTQDWVEVRETPPTGVDVLLYTTMEELFAKIRGKLKDLEDHLSNIIIVTTANGDMMPVVIDALLISP